MISQYLLLFAAAFGAATLLPFYSEILLIAQLESGLTPLWLWLAASLSLPAQLESCVTLDLLSG